MSDIYFKKQLPSSWFSLLQKAICHEFQKIEIDYDKNTVFELSYPVGYYTYKVRKGDWDFSINIIPGDTNLDEIINILDIVYLVNYILYDASSNGHRPNLFNLHKIDLNTDGEINILDVLILIEVIIN